MFQWYKDSLVCYAYLMDIPADEDDHAKDGSSFRKSQWFTRGWTLQELLASDKLHFYDGNWKYFRSRQDIADELAAELGIAPQALEG